VALQTAAPSTRQT